MMSIEGGSLVRTSSSAQLVRTSSARQRELAESARAKARACDRQLRHEEKELRSVRAEMVRVRCSIPGKGPPYRHARADNTIIIVLTDELLVYIAGFLLVGDLAGITALGRLSCVCKHFAAKIICDPQPEQEEERTRVEAAGGASRSRYLTIVGTAAKAVFDAAPRADQTASQCTMETALQALTMTQLKQRLRRGGHKIGGRKADLVERLSDQDHWLRKLWYLWQPVWERSHYSAAHFAMAEGGTTLTAKATSVSQRQPPTALVGGPMTMGGGGAGVPYYVEIESFMPATEYLGAREGTWRGMGDVGVYRKLLDRKSGEFIGVRSGALDHGQGRDEHEEVQRCKLGDILGLLLENGTLTVYKKGAPTGPRREGKGRYDSDGLLVPTYGPPTWDSSVPNMTRLGVAARNLTGEMYWAGSVRKKWDSLRITAKPPPPGWREAHEDERWLECKIAHELYEFKRWLHESCTTYFEHKAKLFMLSEGKWNALGIGQLQLARDSRLLGQYWLFGCFRAPAEIPFVLKSPLFEGQMVRAAPEMSAQSLLITALVNKGGQRQRWVTTGENIAKLHIKVNKDKVAEVVAAIAGAIGLEPERHAARANWAKYFGGWE
jgi:hypothetical protein